MKNSTTNSDFRLPAEWENHTATWLAWPTNSKDWPGKFSPIRWVFAEFIKHLTRSETVRLVVTNERQKTEAERVLQKNHVNLEAVEFFTAPMDRGWMRDCMPTFVQSAAGQKKAIKFGFTGWAKYSNCHNDNKLPYVLSEQMEWELTPALFTHPTTGVSGEFVLEGGSIDCNGRGTLLTTEECLLDPFIQTRNPGLSQSEIESILRSYLGVTNILWLGKGIIGDDTHGHVDDLCRFVNPSTVVLVQENNPRDENYQILQENRERLESMRLETGERLTVVPLPMPHALWFDGMRLPASYANFYISNGAVLVPTFNDPNDRIALGILSELFTDRPVIGIHAVDLVWGLGTLHCLSHEEPE